MKNTQREFYLEALKKDQPHLKIYSVFIVFLFLLWNGSVWSDSTDARSFGQLLLAQANSGASLKNLHKMAQDKEVSVRRIVAVNAGKTGNPAALPLLNKLAKDPNPSVRRAVISSAMEIYKTAVKLLAVVSAEEERSKKTHKKYRFGRSGYLSISQQQLPDFYDYQSLKGKQREKAKKSSVALAGTMKTKILELLNQMARDKRDSIREAVVDASGRTGDPAALALLNRMAKDQSKNVRSAVISSAMKIYKEAYQKISFAIRAYGMRYSQERFSNFYTQMSLYKGWKDRAKSEKKALMLANTAKRNVFQLLNKMAQDTEYSLRSRLVRIISETGGDPAALPLLHILANDQNEWIKKDVISSALTAYRVATEFLSYMAREKRKQESDSRDKRPGVMYKGYKNFYYSQWVNGKDKQSGKLALELAKATKANVLGLLNQMVADKKASIRQEVARVAGGMGNPKASFSLLEKLAGDQNRSVRGGIVFPAVRIYKEAAQFLRNIQQGKGLSVRSNQLTDFYSYQVFLGQDRDSSQQKALALAKATKTNVLELLNTLAKDKEVYVRKSVAQAAGDTGDPEALSLLNQMIKDKNTKVREAVANAIGKLSK